MNQQSRAIFMTCVCFVDKNCKLCEAMSVKSLDINWFIHFWAFEILVLMENKKPLKPYNTVQLMALHPWWEKYNRFTTNINNVCLFISPTMLCHMLPLFSCSKCQPWSCVSLQQLLKKSRLNLTARMTNFFRRFDSIINRSTLDLFCIWEFDGLFCQICKTI